MTYQLYEWRGVDDVSRVERAVVGFGESSLRGHGGSVASSSSTAWQLVVGPGWVTEELTVSSLGEGWSRSLTLTRAARGSWTVRTDARGAADMPAPGIEDTRILDGAIDCDLGLCPLTNIMPIRRLALLDRHVEPVALVMAWVEVPSLRVLRSGQLYGSGTDNTGARRTVRYQSQTRDFDAELVIDGDGMVIDYPTLATRTDRDASH